MFICCALLSVFAVVIVCCLFLCRLVGVSRCLCFFFFVGVVWCLRSDIAFSMYTIVTVVKIKANKNIKHKFK